MHFVFSLSLSQKDCHNANEATRASYGGQQPGGRLNINMSSYQYMDPHVEYKTVSQTSYC